MDVLDNLCNRMKLYSARAGPEFPYIKGGIGICSKNVLPSRKRSHSSIKSLEYAHYEIPSLT